MGRLTLHQLMMYADVTLDQLKAMARRKKKRRGRKIVRMSGSDLKRLAKEREGGDGISSR